MLGLPVDLGERRVRGVYQAITPGGRADYLAAAADVRNPPLPGVLEAATLTTKIVYLYLEPYGEVRVTVRQLEALLGVSHRPAFEALRDLKKLGLVLLGQNARGRPRGVSRRRPDAL